MLARQTKLAAVIVNYRTADLVIQCLESLLPQLADIGGYAIIVDNDSRDDSVSRIKGWIRDCNQGSCARIVESGSNAGFSAGNNIGIRAVEAEYYLLLNSDTIVRPGAINILLQTATEFTDAGIFSPRLEWPDSSPQESCFRYLSPVTELILTAQTGPITALLKRFDVPLPVANHITYPDWTSFACVLLRRQMVNAIGPMDDGFFMYFEDVEYCRRAVKAGWKIVHNPAAKVVHLRGGSSPVKKRTVERKRLPRYYYAARTRYLYLAYGRFGLTAANVLWLLGRCISKSRECLERRGLGVPEKQWIDIWTNWLHPGRPWAQQILSAGTK